MIPARLLTVARVRARAVSCYQPHLPLGWACRPDVRPLLEGWWEPRAPCAGGCGAWVVGVPDHEHGAWRQVRGLRREPCPSCAPTHQPRARTSRVRRACELEAAAQVVLPLRWKAVATKPTPPAWVIACPLECGTLTAGATSLTWDGWLLAWNRMLMHLVEAHDAPREWAGRVALAEPEFWRSDDPAIDEVDGLRAAVDEAVAEGSAERILLSSG